MGETYVIGLYRVYGEDNIRDIVEDSMNRNHLSVQELSIESDVSATSIRRWLAGDSTIKYSTLEKIFATLAEMEKGYA